MTCVIKYTSIFAALFLILFLGQPHAADAKSENSEVVRVKSPFKAEDTLKRVEAAIAKKGLKVFNGINHAVAAREFDKTMPASRVFIFGNPKFGTGLMLKSPMAAIDFPLKGLVYQDDKGQVWIAFNSPEHMSLIFKRHGLDGNMDWYVKLYKSIIADALK